MNAKDYADKQGRDLSKLGRHRLELHLRALAPNATHLAPPVKPKPNPRSSASPWGKPDTYRKSKPTEARYGRTADADVLQRLYPGCVTFAMLSEALGIEVKNIAVHRLKARWGLVAIEVPQGTLGMGHARYVVTKEAAAVYIAAYKAAHS